MSPARCQACGAANARAARYCVACGRALGGARAEVQRARELDTARRLVRAIALLFLGTLAAVSLSALASAHFPVRQGLLTPALLAVVGLGSARWLGPEALRASLAHGIRAPWIAAGVLGGLGAFCAGWLFVSALRALLGGEIAHEAFGSTRVVELVVLAPLVEEWLCRGVLWSALRRALTTSGTALLSAALFALLHGLGGGGWLEYPHRFVAGLVFGLLRARSDSLVPGIVAHALNNALALAVELG
ncbi:MAG: CPBP family intramembrane metalloprotease [Planctomycetes bacterium]|nr:CPBP family intramembrane metalloprotease [Planctomycetota bacterium]